MFNLQEDRVVPLQGGWEIFNLSFVLCIPVQIFEVFFRTGNGVSFVMEQSLDSKEVFHVLPPVQPLLGFASKRLDQRKLRFPVPQHMSIHPYQMTDLAYPEVHLVRYLWGIWSRSFHIKELTLSTSLYAYLPLSH